LYNPPNHFRLTRTTVLYSLNKYIYLLAIVRIFLKDYAGTDELKIMAKEKVLCPFSNKLCEECSLYRGRHYYICYCHSYRGYLGSKNKSGKHPGKSKHNSFEMPDIKIKAMDPFLKLKQEEGEEA
jgi:hypothetical protein